MADQRNKNYFITSIICHVLIVLVFVLGFDTSSPLSVIENTNKNDIISAVILGDSAKSKILPKEPTSQALQQKVNKPIEELTKEEPKPKALPKPAEPKSIQTVKIEKDVIALKLAEKKKLAAKKELEKKKQRELFEKSLLADIKQQTDKHKKIKLKQQKQLQSAFAKTLREQSEKTMRQQLLNEDIKLQGTQNRQAQGEVNKYTALIKQTVSEHWIIPTQSNKHQNSELLIRLAPGGMVLDVQVTKSSGDPALDSSARAAVLKSSPLPVPSDPEAFEAFRHFVLKMKPENVMAGDGMIGAG